MPCKAITTACGGHLDRQPGDHVPCHVRDDLDVGAFIQNVNFLYMALIMWAPMAAVMMLTMKSMYANARVNMALYALFAVAFAGSLYGIAPRAWSATVSSCAR